MEPTRVTRLLPWKSPDGKPCYLDTDGENTGYVSRLADEMEALQLGMAIELIGHAEALLGAAKADARELRFLSARLTEALRDTTRIAESRGDRLAVYCPPAAGPTEPAAHRPHGR
ncbi:hypothetical protein [Streptomyces palmae]|uniref:Uncharacterized protein n=1 Tax=Streptomyces palmae TaxID=1701085 RepID=A0A4Z0HE51_9ACTN|nr:hypothetical protein [Streptomyces palmae]TGB19386.1 hypothetical protein E4099_00725 [Streptomyces palmae]